MSNSSDDNYYTTGMYVCVCGYPQTLAKEFTAATRIMQSSSNELSTPVSGKAKCKTNESDYIMPNNSRADVFRLFAERYDTKSNVSLSRLATLMSSDRTKQIYLWMTIYIYVVPSISF